MHWTSPFRRTVPWVVAALLCSSGGLAQNIDPFPAESPGSIASGPDGAMWFTTDMVRIQRMDATGAVTSFLAPNAGLGITLGPDGNLWFTESNGRIARMTTSGTVTEFDYPNAYQITTGPDGNLWFTTLSNRIGRMTTSGETTNFPLPDGTAAMAITAGPDGNLWFTELLRNRIGRITTAGTVTEFQLLGLTYPQGITAGPDGNLWFAEDAPRIGRITPTGEITEFPVSGGNTSIVAGPDGNLWSVGDGGVLRRTTTSGSTTDFSIPWTTTGWIPPSPSGIAAAPDGSIWIANGEGNRVIAFALDTSTCVATAKTLCLNNGRFRVTADWKASDGSTGHGHGVGLTPNAGYFWFFDAANIELVTKILNGCSSNQHYWAFAAGLTNVEVTMTVTDTLTGVPRVYVNPQGTAFAPIQDTAAFAACQ